MKNKTKPTGSNVSVLFQICNLIPGHLVSKLARECGAEQKARTFTCWSHVFALLYAQITHAIGLNDVCDALQCHRGLLSRIRGATPPNRNTLSHANKIRPAEMAEKLFWSVLDHVSHLKPGFAKGKNRGLARRFRRAIYVVDSTVIELVANCMDWAKHRRRKAAAKCHLRLDLQSFLPRFAIVDTANEHDNLRSRELCSGIKAGEIVIFDRGYVDYQHLNDLHQRGVFWVTRGKDNLDYRVLESLPSDNPRVVKDELIGLSGVAGARFEGIIRRVVAMVEVDGHTQEMVFLTNNTTWSPASIADLYRCRWQIEVFFKQIKQTLQMADFLGHSANAVKWQVWIALLIYVLLRFQSYLHAWPHSFTRLFTLIRAVLWRKIDVAGLIRGSGTAGGHFRNLAQPEQAYFAGF